MTVEEVKALLPEASVVKLDVDARYLILADEGRCSIAGAEYLKVLLESSNIKASVLLVNGKPEDAIRILELKPDEA